MLLLLWYSDLGDDSTDHWSLPVNFNEEKQITTTTTKNDMKNMSHTEKCGSLGMPQTTSNTVLVRLKDNIQRIGMHAN